MRSFQPAALATVVLSASNALRMAVQLAILPVLARLVGPADYGLVALAMPFVLFCNVMADAGLGNALARRQEVTREVESTVFWLAGALGLILTLAVAGLAWPVAMAIGEPALAPLLIALSPVMILCALTSASNARAIRERRFGVFAGGDIFSTVVSSAIALTLAFRGAGAWSLVVQQVVLWVCKFTWVFLASRVTIRFHCRPSEVRDLLRFGSHVTGSNVADFASRNIDNLIIGAVLGTVPLGYYAIAYQVVRVPDMIISGPLCLYIFTAASKAAHAGSRKAVHDLAAAGIRLGAAFMAPMFLGLALVSDLATAAVLGPKWMGAAEPLRYLAGAGFCFAMCSVMRTTLMGVGRSGLQLRLSIMLSATTIASVGASVWFGVGAVAATLACSMTAALAIYIDRMAAGLEMPRLRLVAAFGPALLGCAAMAVVVLAARSFLAGSPPLVELGVTVTLGALAYAAALWMMRRRLVEDARAFGRADRSEVQAPGVAAAA